MQKLKEKLLSLGIFDDNEYLDFYCELVESNRNTKREKFKTQKHHIIPKCYYKVNNKEIDNSDSNCVNLLYKDHVLAHYYLCLFTINNRLLKYYVDNAFLHLIKADASLKIKVDNFNLYTLNEYQKIYEEWKILNSALQKGHKAWNKGLTKETDERVAKYSKPRQFSKEHNEHLRQSVICYYKNHDGTMKGKHLSIESRIKVSLANKGKSRKSKHPEITSKKLSDKTKNNWANNSERQQKLINYNKTRVLSKDSLHKMSLSQPNRKEVYKYDINYRFICKYDSVNQCAKDMGIKKWRVVNACKTNKFLKEGFYLSYDALLKEENK